LFSSTKSRIAAVVAVGALTYFLWTKSCTKNKPKEKTPGDIQTEHLITAARAGNIKAIEKAIAAGADVNGLSADEKFLPVNGATNGMVLLLKGTTVLMNASTPEVAKKLIQEGADIHCIARFKMYGREFSESFLTHSLKYGSETALKMIDMLLETKPNDAEWVDSRANHEGETLLMCAIKHGDLAVVKKLVEKAHATIHKKIYNNRIGGFVSALEVAESEFCRTGTENYLEIIRYLDGPGPLGDIAENTMTLEEIITFAQQAKPHELLGVAKDANRATILKAFHKLSVRFHPDKNLTEKDKADMAFKLIEQARAAMLKNFKR
jgi:hypothetical protein